ncbi:helix-turn-helix domain-containing protein [Planctomycetes bacterium K23_9]|uniref:Melibiose operon regulatory protein n=1 Tax=Stieleria marina TaxID=1930275 RepID=A0A517NYL0_9BACT|nr:Melibiose operon regulatory protein [Planctomycetes bacterium K23_9]
MSKTGEAIRQCFFDSIDDAAQLLRLFDFLPNTYLYVKDIDGRFVAMNDEQMQLKDVKHQRELWGKTDLDLHSLHWGRLYQQEDRKVMESGRELPDQIWLVSTADGSLGTFCSSKIPVRGRDGKVIGIAGVMYRIDQSQRAASVDDPIKMATDLIAARYDEPLEITDIAEQVGLSTSQLNRRFRAMFQMPPSEYLQRVRVHEASRRLADGDRAISEIALGCGFYDQAHLTRTFRRWMGMTPREFRRLSM